MDNNRILKLEDKIKKYERILKDLLNDNLDNNDNLDSNNSNFSHNDNIDLSESVFIERDIHGDTRKLVRSKLDKDDNYLVIEHGKNLYDINKSEYHSIKSQDDFSNFETTRTYYKKTSSVWGWLSLVSGIGKFAIGFF